MIGYDGEKIKHYRIDKMEKTELIREKREGYKQYKQIRLEDYTETHFGMYGGRLCDVKLLCKNSIANVIVDQFGTNIKTKNEIVNNDKGFFKVEVKVNVSNQFYGWIAALGGDVKIIEPESVRNEYIERLRKVLDEA